MPDGPAYVIVGASLAGAKAAETLREEGFDGTVVLVGQEAERPYERPPLSKGFLLGKAAKSSIYVHEDSWYPAHGVDLLLCLVNPYKISHESVMQTIELMGTEVIPAFR